MPVYLFNSYTETSDFQIMREIETERELIVSFGMWCDKRKWPMMNKKEDYLSDEWLIQRDVKYIRGTNRYSEERHMLCSV